MRSINLLPPVPLVQRLLVPLVTVSVLFFGILGAGLVYYHIQSQFEIARQQQILQDLDKQIASLAAERRLDANSQAYKKLLEESQKLIEARRDWQQIVLGLLTPLPQGAMTKDLAVNANKLTVTLEVAGMQAAAEYVIHLQKTNMFESVAMTSAEARTTSPEQGQSQATDESVRSEPAVSVKLDIGLKPTTTSK